jgi:hypothetical protein
MTLRFSVRSALLFLVLVSTAVLSAPAQQPPNTMLLAGYGGADYERSLGPAYHLKLRRTVIGRDSVVVSPAAHDRWVVPRLELQAEVFGQAGRGGTRVAGCRQSPGQLCAQGADPLYLLGAGLVTRWDATAARHAVQLYFLPATAGVYVRGYTSYEQPLGSAIGSEDEHVSLGGGVGNGLGLRLRVGQTNVLAEVRAILIHDLQGGRGGSLPVSIGIAW